jgi:hypothetical protein
MGLGDGACVCVRVVDCTASTGHCDYLAAEPVFVAHHEDRIAEESPRFTDAYTTDDIVYEWKKESPVQLKDGLNKSLPSFALSSHETGYCTSKTNTGTRRPPGRH